MNTDTQQIQFGPVATGLVSIGATERPILRDGGHKVLAALQAVADGHLTAEAALAQLGHGTAKPHPVP